MGKHKWYRAIWDVSYFSKGEKKWSFKKENALVDEGERLVLESFFRNQLVPDRFKVGFCYGAMSEETTAADIPNEPVGNGYSRQTLERDTIDFDQIALDEGDWMVYTKEMTIVASGGDIGPINNAFMVTEHDDTGSVYLLSFMGMPTTTIIYDGDLIAFRISIKCM